MQPQLYRNVEHSGLGLLQVLKCYPKGEKGTRLYHFYDVIVQDDCELQFIMKDAFWPSFVPVSQEENTPAGKEQLHVLGSLGHVAEYQAIVDKAVPSSTKEYFGLLREILKEGGILKAVRFDVDVTIGRLANFYIFR